MKRRRVLLNFALVASVVKLLPSSIVYAGTEKTSGDDAVPGIIADRLADLFADPAGAEKLGQAYLAQAIPELSWRDRLRRVSAGLGGQPLGLSDQQMRGAFEQQCRRDLAAQEFEIVDGWVLASCEADVCALLALARMA